MFEQLMSSILKPDFVFSIFRMTAPILFAALAAVVAEKAGVTNIGLEGTMSLSALFAVMGSYWTSSAITRAVENAIANSTKYSDPVAQQAYIERMERLSNWLSPLIGVLVSVIIGILIALMIGFFALRLKTDIVLAGIAVNMVGGGGAIFLLYVMSGERGNSAALVAPSVPNLEIPLIKDIPYIGEMLSGHNILTYVAFLCVLLVFIYLYKTPVGLKIRAVGENKSAADSVGVSVKKIQYLALGISGLFCGLGGAYMSLYYSRVWSNGFIAGRGFIALAAQAMGRGEPLGAMLSSLLFGFANAVASKVEGMQGISSHLVKAIPYVVTILGLAIYALATIKRVKRIRKRQAVKAEGSDNA